MTKDEFFVPLNRAFEIHQKSPYKDMWKNFSREELMEQAEYKAKRGSLLPSGEGKIEDDILDAINMLIFAYFKIKEDKFIGGGIPSKCQEDTMV